MQLQLLVHCCSGARVVLGASVALTGGCSPSSLPDAKRGDAARITQHLTSRASETKLADNADDDHIVAETIGLLRIELCLNARYWSLVASRGGVRPMCIGVILRYCPVCWNVGELQHRGHIQVANALASEFGRLVSLLSSTLRELGYVCQQDGSN